MSWTKRDAAATFQRMVEERHADIGRRIARLREEKGWSQETLAYEAKVAVRTISRLENGGNEGRGGTMRRVAEALGTDLAGLLGGVETLSTTITFESGATHEWVAQIDRVERKLDAIMQHLDLTLSGSETPHEVAESAGRRRASKPRATGASRPPRKGKDQAA